MKSEPFNMQDSLKQLLNLTPKKGVYADVL